MMRLTVDELFEKLIIDDAWRICFQGIISANGIDINLAKARDVVGNIMQEWLEGWLKKNDIEYSPNENTQMPPDVFLSPDDKTKDLLEVKAFNYEATPGFDIADFNAFQTELIREPYMVHTKYIIFGYVMQDDGFVVIKKMWLKNVWEICRPMENWPLNLQVKKNVVHKIRPGKWYADGERSKFKQFASLEHFISAIDETVFRNPDTRKFSGEWLSKFTKSYQKHYGVKLDIPRWNDIAEEYVNKKEKNKMSNGSPQQDMG